MQSLEFWNMVRKLTLLAILLLVAAGKIKTWAMVAVIAASLAAQVMPLVLARKAEGQEKEPQGRTARNEQVVGIGLTALLLVGLLSMMG